MQCILKYCMCLKRGVEEAFPSSFQMFEQGRKVLGNTLNVLDSVTMMPAFLVKVLSFAKDSD